MNRFETEPMADPPDMVPEEALFDGMDAAKRKQHPSPQTDGAYPGFEVPSENQTPPKKMPRDRWWDIRRHMPRPEAPMKRKPKANR